VTQILADAEMAKQIQTADGPVNVVDEMGTVIAVCTPIKFPHSPYTREEIEAARRQCREHPEECKTLAEFWADMEKRHGSRS
jgi:hypothetical protein